MNAVWQVHRIQNKLLWKVYASNLDAMKGLVNGGFATLWHGTSRADPWDIYAAEHGELLLLSGSHAE